MTINAKKKFHLPPEVSQIPEYFRLRADLKYLCTLANSREYFITLQPNTLGSPREKIPNLCQQVPVDFLGTMRVLNRPVR
jgi:hypothetical protein